MTTPNPICTKINAAIATVDGLGTGDNLLLTAAERSAIAANTAKNSYPSGDATKVGHLSVSQAVDLDAMETQAANGQTAFGWGDHGSAGYAVSVTLASTANGNGAALIGVEDSSGNFTGTTVEAALAELAASGGGAPEGTAVLSTGEAGGTKFLREDGDGTCSWQAIPGGGDALTSSPLSQFAATTSAQLAGVLSDETGSGSAVFATSPTLVTPNLGTPSAVTLTNGTGLPTSGLAQSGATTGQVPQWNGSTWAPATVSGGSTVTSGAGAPSSTPGGLGYIYVDTTNDAAYIAADTSSSADWDEVLTAASGATLGTKATPEAADEVLHFNSAASSAPVTSTWTQVISGLGLTTLTGSQTLTNKTLTAPVINGTVTGTAKLLKSDGTGVTGADDVTNVMSLTNSEYTAIGSPDAATIYLITDA